jgi:hypothetical protein
MLLYVNTSLGCLDVRESLIGGCLSLLPVKEGTPYSHFAAQLLLIGAGIGLTVTAMTSALLGDS